MSRVFAKKVKNFCIILKKRNPKVNLDFLQLAIDEAYKYQLLTYPNPAVGAVVVQGGAVVSIEAHQRAGSSHAEVLALVSAYESIKGISVSFDKFDSAKAHHFLLNEVEKEFFANCTLYVTLEPCAHIGKTPSCASLLAKLRPKKVVIGVLDPISSHSGGVEMLQQASVTVEVVNSKEASVLIEPFIIWQKRAFVLFKLAQSCNGQISGGYISSKESLKHVHKLRQVCTKLLIGGNTVRVDRPTLDCRFTNSKAPDVVIYSKSKVFDATIALFGVANREVAIVDSLDFLQKPGFVLVEGGEGMLNALKENIDWLLLYQAPVMKSGELNYNIDAALEFVHIDKNSSDLLIWSRFIS